MSEKYPQKIYVELTTRCNLRCSMCVKYAPGSRIEERDMTLADFKRLLPALPHAHNLILSGIGEPLLHPDLLAIVALARAHLPAQGMIGIQSNGFLVNEAKAESLLGAGLDTLCLSLDSLACPPLGLAPPIEHSFGAVEQAVRALVRARGKINSRFRIGLQTVLGRNNVHELPAIVRWAGENGVDYILTTHLIHYDRAAEAAGLFDPNTAEAVALFRKYRALAAARGLDLADCLTVYCKLSRSEADQSLRQLLAEMRQEATEQDIRLHLRSLFAYEDRGKDALRSIFADAARLAEECGIDLHLPPLRAVSGTACNFMRDNGVAITVDGGITPCHFLWHGYNCLVQGEEIRIDPRIFGFLRNQSLEAVWQGEPYRRFRGEAGISDHASCWSCAQGPCPDLVNDTGSYANDCHGSVVPCGFCQWSLGGIRCL